jgi:hypothetical protein
MRDCTGPNTRNPFQTVMPSFGMPFIELQDWLLRIAPKKWRFLSEGGLTTNVRPVEIRDSRNWFEDIKAVGALADVIILIPGLTEGILKEIEYFMQTRVHNIIHMLLLDLDTLETRAISAVLGMMKMKYSAGFSVLRKGLFTCRLGLILSCRLGPRRSSRSARFSLPRKQGRFSCLLGPRRSSSFHPIRSPQPGFVAYSSPGRRAFFRARRRRPR